MNILQTDKLRVIKNGRHILNCRGLEFKKQEALALIGPNGAGKSTLLKVLAGINKPDFGQIMFNNQNIFKMTGRKRAQLIGFVPQKFSPCWNQTVKELLDIAVSRTLTPLKCLNEARLNFELDKFLPRRWSTLSGGEQGRVLLAMAFAGSPPIILADEPGAALDIRHRLNMIEMFSQKGAEALVIVCLHDLDLAFRYFKNIILLNNGEIVFQGPANELFESSLLDEVFQVKFNRLKTKEGPMLQAISI